MTLTTVVEAVLPDAAATTESLASATLVDFSTGMTVKVAELRVYEVEDVPASFQSTLEPVFGKVAAQLRYNIPLSYPGDIETNVAGEVTPRDGSFASLVVGIF